MGVDVVLEDLYKLAKILKVVGNMVQAYISRHQSNDGMFEQGPRVRQMVQTPSTALDQKQTPHLKHVGNHPFQSRL